MKNKAGKVLETSVVVRTQATREFRKEGQEHLEPKKSPENGAPKIFESQNFEFFKRFVAWCPRRCSFYCIIVYFGGKMAEKIVA